MDFINELIQKYVEEHTAPEPEVLREINRETNQKVLMPRMISGHLQGRTLAMLSQMIRPRNVLEIGTYTGYSAICLAEGLQDDGKIFTIDINDELESMVRANFEKAGLLEKVTYIVGNAIDVIPELDEQFDLVFIDADKENYLNYYKLCFPKVASGGYFFIDNVLWSGKVIPEGRKKLDEDTQAIIDFNAYVHKDINIQNVLLPIRDGLMILRKV